MIIVTAPGAGWSPGHQALRPLRRAVLNAATRCNARSYAGWGETGVSFHRAANKLLNTERVPVTRGGVLDEGAFIVVLRHNLVPQVDVLFCDAQRL